MAIPDLDHDVERFLGGDDRCAGLAEALVAQRQRELAQVIVHDFVDLDPRHAVGGDSADEKDRHDGAEQADQQFSPQ